MSYEYLFSDDLLVTFVRIGQERNVPVLQVPAGPVEIVRKSIHAFVAERLGSDEFTVQLWEAAGFIDLGTHSAGAFTIVTATAFQPETQPTAASNGAEDPDVEDS